VNPDRWRQVERVCHDALERAPDTRADFLDEACAGDEALRREVESLLAEQPGSDDFLSAPAASLTGLAAKPGPSLVGRTLGHYRVDTFLGAGGMGEVYRARDTKLGRDVAIKVLPADLASVSGHLARFEREARALAELNHPNILTIHDVGTDAGMPFVVTELLEGETLREVMSRRAPTTRQVLWCVAQAAQGLAAAHRRGLVHRDLKPENLFLTTDGVLKILDFGLARHAVTLDRRPGVAHESPVTEAGVLLGTVAYMSPEQLTGQAVDARSDIFSLGVVLCELLTGRHPFRRDSVGATLHAIAHDPPPELPPSRDGPVPPALVRIVRRCLRKHRDERFQSAHELLVAFEGVSHGTAAHAPLDEFEQRGPYPGLRSFTEDEAGVFFGRDAEISTLWERIVRQPMLAVIGSSGAGKTSFLRAGVIPARPDGWAAVACTPGRAPMRSLGQALAPQLAGDPDALRHLVAFDETAVALELLRRWRTPFAGALVVVDQFEELFTLHPPDVQGRFCEFLGRVAREADVRLIVSVRDDFFIRCCEQAPLAPVLNELTAILPLGRDALRQALVEPARVLGYRFEDEALVDEVVDAVEGSRAALPLLAFAVARLWEHRDLKQQVLTREGYRRIGGVDGALAQHAETILDRIGTGREQVVREMFRSLVTADGTRAVIERDDLLSACPDRELASDVLRELLDARLLTSYDVKALGGQRAHHVVEIAHESLLRAWPRLVRWQTQDEGSAQMRDHLRQAAHLWDECGRTRDLLWTGTAFREFAVWRERYTAPLTPAEDAFAAAMARQARRVKALRRAAVVAVILALGAVALAVGISRHFAVESARRAVASKVVALGRLELDRFPTAAIAYALASLDMSDTIEARLLAVEALWRGPTARLLEMPPTSACSRVAFDPTGSALACAGFSDKIVVWDDTGVVSHAFAGVPARADIRELAFDDRGERLVSWLPGDSLLRVWSLASGELATFDASPEWAQQTGHEIFATFGPVRPGSDERVLRRWSLADARAVDLERWRPPAGMRLDQPGLRPVAIDPSLRWLAFGDGHDVVLREIGTRNRDVARASPGAGNRRLARHGARIREVRFDQRAEQLISLDDTGLFCLWSVPDGRLRRELRAVPPHRYSLPVFSPDGSLLTWTTGDGTTLVWDLDRSSDDPPLALRRTDVREAGNQAFDPQGRWLATAGWGSVAFWPLRLPHVSAFHGHVEGPIHDLAFSHDSRLLASCARDGALLWTLDASGAGKRRVELGGDYYCYGVEFAPDREHLALASPYLGVFLVPFDGGTARRVIDLRGKRAASQPLAFDATGRTLATAAMYAPDAADMLLQVVDLPSRAVQAVPLRTDGSTDGYASGAQSLKYLADGRLLVAGANGLRRWDPATGELSHLIWGDRFAAVDTDRAGRTVVALTGRLAPSRLRLFEPEMFVLDPLGRPVRAITTHGNALMPTLAVHPEGRIVVTGDANGIVRVGAIAGHEPHLLVGHAGPVNRVAISPDGRWIASASGSEIRLWPMPDLTRPPLHTLPRATLIAKLQSLTNLRVVADPASATGWSVHVGPFPGWHDVPDW
jgi:serine/threonine protein kinase/WD40 repeat protein